VGFDHIVKKIAGVNLDERWLNGALGINARFNSLLTGN